MRTLARRALGMAALASALAWPTARAQRAVRGLASRAAPPWSVRMADAMMRAHPVTTERWDYAAGVALLAVERVGETRHDARYLAYVRRNMDRFVQPDGSIATYVPDEANLDQINQGRLLFALADRTHDPRYLTAAARLRDQLRRQPRTADGGFWHKRIYPHQMWLDGLYMAEPFYAEFAARSRDSAAFDDVARQFLLAALHTRDPATGLLYHAWDETRSQPWADPRTGHSPHFWGRAVGWYAMALVDALDYFPATHPDHAALVRVLQDLAAAVERVQDPVTGLWFQVLDEPNRPGNYREASASSMLAYALAKGARKGYLDAHYRAVAERAHAGIVANLVRVAPDGTPSLTGICKVAGLGGTPLRDGSYAYYVSEPIVADDYKGVGPFILASLEFDQ